MSTQKEPSNSMPPVYEITILGRLDAERSAWFDGLEISYQAGITRLTGPLQDAQALFGVIERIRDLGMSLVEVRLVG